MIILWPMLSKCKSNIVEKKRVTLWTPPPWKSWIEIKFQHCLRDTKLIFDRLVPKLNALERSFPPHTVTHLNHHICNISFKQLICSCPKKKKKCPISPTLCQMWDLSILDRLAFSTLPESNCPFYVAIIQLKIKVLEFVVKCRACFSRDSLVAIYLKFPAEFQTHVKKHSQFFL